MPKTPINEQKPRKPRKDRGTRRNENVPEDKFYAFRLSPVIPEEAAIIDAIDAYKDDNPGHSLRDIIVKYLGSLLQQEQTKEERIVETLEEQIERLSSSIDRLLTLNIQASAARPAVQEDGETSGVNMDYLKRIQATLRGTKK